MNERTGVAEFGTRRMYIQGGPKQEKICK